MIRILAEFDDAVTAFAAIQGLAASSYNVDDLRLHATQPDGTHVNIPVRERSMVSTGFFGGGVLGAIGGVGVAMTTVAPGSLFSTVAVGAGLGAAIGAAMGIGWWNVQIAKQVVPDDTAGFVVVVQVPEGRAPATRATLERLGGREAAPRLLG